MGRKKEVRKLIDLPIETLKGLASLANQDRMAVKNYIEKVLIDHIEIATPLQSKKQKK